MSSVFLFFFSSRRRHTRLQGDWSSDVCSSDLLESLLFGTYTNGAARRAAGPSMPAPAAAYRFVGTLSPVRGVCAVARGNGPPALSTSSARVTWGRSEERRVGKEGRSRWAPDH